MTTKKTKTTAKTTKTKATTRTTKKSPTSSAKPKLLAPVEATLARLHAAYPDAHCELAHRDAFELLVATVLSAQATDVSVNKATPTLFSRWPNARALAAAPVSEVEKAIGTIGMFRQKAKRIVELSKLLIERHGGDVPSTLDALIALPGVGRKTANVVLGVWFEAPEGVVVDTHVQRLAQRLGWSKHDDPIGIEQDLMKALPRAKWDEVSHVLIWHGRRCCGAIRPACDRCPVRDACAVADRAENVGRK